MQKLQKARQNLRKNSKKGFTLVELIVVIVIIAILIAALTPAILGVIQRANVTADQADARSVMMAGSVAGLSQTPPRRPTEAEIIGEITGVSNVRPGAYNVYFAGSMAVGAEISAAAARSGVIQSVGDVVTDTNVMVTVNIP